MKKLTTEEFIRKAREKHGNKFGYENVVYVNSHTPVKITCLTCNEIFPQNPNNHLRGWGCNKCRYRTNGEKSRKTIHKFIEDAVKVHGTKYGYDKVVYVDSHTPLKITCLVCDKDFLQSPTSHISGCGCPDCGNKAVSKKLRKTINKFIEDAIKVHGIKYGYDKVVYVNSNTPVKITCIKCEKDFLQTPDSHLHGGCPTCGVRINAEIKKKRAADTFITRAIKVHGKKYGYDKTVYIDARTNVLITCLVCNEEFPQTPGHHLQGQGCITCAYRLNGEKRRNTAAAEFVCKAVKVHGDKYGYENVDYVGAHTPVKITCLKCKRDFLQTPDNHFNGSGCSTCVNKTEGIVASKLEEIFEPLGFKVEHMGNFVSKGVGKMDIRITKEDLIIFVEVDGFQHFRDVKYQKSKVIDVQKRDLEKYIRAIERGHKVIRIDQEWVWNSQAKNNMEWASRLYDTIVKLDSGTEPSIDEMFLSDKSDKYHDHLCYRHCKT